MTWLVYLGHLIFFSSSSIFDNILGEFVRRRKSHLHKISKPKLSRWKNKIKYRLVVALFLSLSLSNSAPQKKLQNLLLMVPPKVKTKTQFNNKNSTQSLSCKQHSLTRNGVGVGAGRSMTRIWWPTTYEVSGTSFSCIQRRTWTPWTCWMHHSPLGNSPWHPFTLSQPSSIALARLQPLVIRVFWLCKILQTPHICQWSERLRLPLVEFW